MASQAELFFSVGWMDGWTDGRQDLSVARKHEVELKDKIYPNA